MQRLIAYCLLLIASPGARQGIEPCLTVSKTVVRIHHTRKPKTGFRFQVSDYRKKKYPCQELNLVRNLRRVECSPLHLKDIN